MTAALTTPTTSPSGWRPYWPVMAGLLALFVPTCMRLWETLWQTDEQGHAPLILAAALWVFYTLGRDALKAAGKPAGLGGWLLVLGGLLAYFCGRVLDIVLLELGSLIPLIAGTLALLYGWGTVLKFRFPLFFLIFALPVPGFITDSLTGPLKLGVSVLAENLLYHVGYPIARSGVSLTLGQYQMLVADACSGLNSMFSLLATGIFFVYLVNRPNRIHNTLLLLAIPPIAFIANVVRVIIICLVTYYYGDEAGQGFVHGAAGVVLFLVSLTLMFVADFLLELIFRKKKPQAA